MSDVMQLEEGPYSINPTVEALLLKDPRWAQVNNHLQDRYILFTNLGNQKLYKPLAAPLVPLTEDSELWQNPGFSLQLLNGGKIRVITPCCFSKFLQQGVSRKKRLYMACGVCQQPLWRAPLPSETRVGTPRDGAARQTVQRQHPGRRRTVSLTDFLEVWFTTIIDPLEGALIKYDFQVFLQQLHLVRVAKEEARQVAERAERMQLRDSKLKEKHLKELARFKEIMLEDVCNEDEEFQKKFESYWAEAASKF